MNINYREIARLKRKGESNRNIARILSVSRNTVNVIIQKILSSGYSLSEIESMEKSETDRVFKSTVKERESSYVLPDYKELSKELFKPGVTMQLLWEEYFDECRFSSKQAYQLTQFKKYFREYLEKKEFSDIINHKAGERLEVDWAGTRPRWQDPDTGEIVSGWLFVGVLPFSGYGYAQVFADMKQSSWVTGHVNMFDYFGGVSKVIVPDNLKTGITKNNKDEIVINKTYSDMAEHYSTVIIPTRVRRPKDKASVEGSVKQFTTGIIARMRNHQFFSMEEYNQQLLKVLEELNKKPFQKKDGSRYRLFQEIEKTCLIPLPDKPYVLCEWKKAKVATNSHISLAKCYYSVPYEHIGEEVDLKIYENELEIYLNQVKLSSFPLEKNKIGVYSTIPEHMPINSNAYGEWNSTRYLNWAKQKGPSVYQVVQAHFDGVKIEQQKYRTVHNILSLASNYDNLRLESACQYALKHFTCPNYKNLKAILVNKQDLTGKQEKPKETKQLKFLRGSEYYE